MVPNRYGRQAQTVKKYILSHHIQQLLLIKHVINKIADDGKNILVLYEQDSRLISTGKLQTLLFFHTLPINVVVFDESYNHIG